MRRRAFAAFGLASTLALSSELEGQRTETPTTVTKSDIAYRDATCTIRVSHKVATASGTAWATVANGSTVSAPAYNQDFVIDLTLTNKGTVGATFQTRIRPLMPPTSWTFINIITREPVPAEELTFTSTVDPGQSIDARRYYLKHIQGQHNFVIDSTVDLPNAVREADETNNTCRITFTQI